MSDADERLRALDPVTTPYQLLDLETTVSRITRQRVESKGVTWRNFRLRIASAIAASALLSAAAISAFALADSGPAILALQGPAYSWHASVKTQFTNLQPSSAPSYIAANALPGRNTVPSMTSYQLVLAHRPRTEVRSIAKAFGVHARAVRLSDGWSVHQRHGAVVDYLDRPLPHTLPHWYYSASVPLIAPATYASTSHAVLPTHRALVRMVDRLVSRLHFGYRVASPRFSSSVLTQGTSSNTATYVNVERVSFVVDVNDAPTNQTLSVSVNSHDSILYASGPAFFVRASVSYPLQTPLEAIRALNASTHAPALAASSAQSASSSSTSPSITRNASAQHIVSWTLVLEPYRLSNGSLTLLPVYNFSETRSTSSSHAVSLVTSELAISPTFIRG